MKIEGNKVIADKGKLLTKNGIYTDYIYLGINDNIDSWIEVDESEKPTIDEPSIEENDNNYEGLVESKIRERYSVSQEFAILRQRDVKVDEYQAYYDYCEECKQIAKDEKTI